MKIQELRQLSEKKLKDALHKARRDASVARFHVLTGQNQDTAKLKSLRKMVAQILTLLKEKSQISSHK